VRKGKKRGRKGLTYEDIKEIIIHLISIVFTIYTYINIHTYIYISTLLNYISVKFAEGMSREN